MEFDININALFRDVITKVDSRLQVCRNASLRFPDARLELFDIVNRMGEASARAQGLPGAITTGRKLETSDHHLYVMKDPEGSRGQGAVIGILKMGRKRLFVYDRHGQQWEMNPLCVLDFYVHESRQRMGCGRRLFDFMLQAEKLSPHHLAVDRPSHKFSSFLAKHYGLKTEIPQVNNFVIFDGFFTKRPGDDFIHNRRNANVAKPADYPSTACKAEPQSAPLDHNYNRQCGYQRSTTGWPALGSRPPSGHRSNRMPAGLPSVLPRHQVHHQDNSLKDLNLNPRPTQNGRTLGRQSPKGLTEMELRSVSAGSSSGNTRGSALSLHNNLYSRHQTVAVNDTTASDPHYTTAPLPPTTTTKRPPSSSRNTNGPQRPPSSGMNGLTKRERSPPLLRREGPPRDYLQSLNLHQNYQGRAGHLVVPSDPRVGLTQPPAATTTTTAATTTKTENSIYSQPSANKPVENKGAAPYSYRGGYYTQAALQANGDTSWTVFGVLRNQHQLSARNHGHSRLW